ncbi:MAG: hypothetical protein IT385_04365 [Deltaproteobacteria bacterium]|nr:hypothetical protein [Deltaproteobacteria bacterium]
MPFRFPLVVSALALGLAAASPAAAEPVTWRLSGVIDQRSDLGDAPVGAPFRVVITMDTAAIDADATPWRADYAQCVYEGAPVMGGGPCGAVGARAQFLFGALRWDTPDYVRVGTLNDNTGFSDCGGGPIDLFEVAPQGYNDTGFQLISCEPSFLESVAIPSQPLDLALAGNTNYARLMVQACDNPYGFPDFMCEMDPRMCCSNDHAQGTIACIERVSDDTDVADEPPDVNGNGIPDGCEAPPDADGDGVLDADDACPDTAEGPVSSEGCALAQTCPCEGWRNHGGYVRCVDAALDALVLAGALSPEEADARQSAAARSSCGRSSSRGR